MVPKEIEDFYFKKEIGIIGIILSRNENKYILDKMAMTTLTKKITAGYADYTDYIVHRFINLWNLRNLR